MWWRLRHLAVCKHKGCMLCALLRHPQHWYYGDGEGLWSYYIFGAWLLLELGVILGR